MLFGVGNENAEVLFIGEGPGEQEDLSGQPFVGRAGKLLDIQPTIDLDRTNIYIANMVKCRPPKNRDPLEIEKKHGYLGSADSYLIQRLLSAWEEYPQCQ